MKLSFCSRNFFFLHVSHEKNVYSSRALNSLAVSQSSVPRFNQQTNLKVLSFALYIYIMYKKLTCT